MKAKRFIDDNQVPSSQHLVDPEAEQSVLGAILLKPDCIYDVLTELQPQDFVWENHRLIYQTMLDLCNSGQPIDMVIVTGRLKDMNLLDKAGGAVFLASLSEQVGTAANVQHYVRRVRDKALVRRLRKTALEIAATCEQPFVSAKELVDWAENLVHEKCWQPSVQGKSQALRELLDQEIKILEEIHETKKPPGLPTGYSGLDRFVSWCPRDLVVLAGRTSMGKTSLALNLALRAAKQGIKVGFVSLEMSKEQLTRRLLAMQSGVNAVRLNRVKLSVDEWMALYHAREELENLCFFIDDTPAQSILDIRSGARRVQVREGLELMFVDYLQLVRPYRKGRTREEEVAEISRGLKALAGELGIPVIAVSQLNRKLEERPDKRPKLSDLRESGALEQDADLVLFLYRDDVYRDDSPDAGKAEVIIGKNRNGRTGTVKLAYQAECLRFENLEEEP